MQVGAMRNSELGAAPIFPGMEAWSVTRTSGLLCRRPPACMCNACMGAPLDAQRKALLAGRQTGSLRYGRPEVCVTSSSACAASGIVGRFAPIPTGNVLLQAAALFCGVLLLLISIPSSRAAERVSLVFDTNAGPRVVFGSEKLKPALEAAGYTVEPAGDSAGGRRVIIGAASKSAEIGRLRASGQLKLEDSELRKEGFVLAACADGTVAVAGGDDSGTLYGCLELARRIRQSGKLPAEVRFADAPQFVLRGPCIGMQKTYILQGRHVYEYPYTPDLFPFFYDKEFWREYLDFLVENRMNTLYLWNGHPFASLVKLPDYPYALEVPEDVFQKNVEMFRYITREADRRGIWLVQMFYSIVLSKPFAEHNGLQTQLSAPTPLAEDYMRKSIAEFVRQYPHVGIMVCLGEALQDLDMQIGWFTNVVAPGVELGMKAAGITEQPPLVLRTHATDARAVVPVAIKVYTNLFTEAKYNGESLTTWEPRGVWQDIHRAMGKLGATHLVNIHILANLEPFRYGAQRFIQKCVVASRDRLGARGVHLYPLFYWNWPDSPDLTKVPLKQWERDWIWYEAWARYAWNPDIPEAEDRAYWVSRLTEYYGNTNAAARILDAYNDAGECAPRLLRRFGITEGNRQTLSLGMTLDELVNPMAYKAYEELWKSQAPPGERLQEYAEKEWNHEAHQGETPPQIIRETLDYSARAVEEIESAAPLVTRNREEYERLRNDVHCIRAMTENYAGKAQAALRVLRYNYSRDPADMDAARTDLASSLASYKHLADLTASTYRYANSMQTSQRKIPVSGGAHGMGTNYHWTQLVGFYETELREFEAKVALLHSTNGLPAEPAAQAQTPAWPAAAFKLLGAGAETYTVRVGARVFSDRDFALRALAPELNGLTGIRFSREAAKKGKYQPIEFEVSEPVQVLVGYFKSKEAGWLQVPNLETAAQADERGGVEPVLRNAAVIERCPGLDVHAFRYEVGRQKLELIGKGAFVVLGVVPESARIQKRDAGLEAKP